MISLHDKESGQRIGTLSEEHLQFLIDQLEEESGSDRDYYIDEQTLELLTEAGGDDELLDMLREALDGRDGIEIEWSHR